MKLSRKISLLLLLLPVSLPVIFCFYFSINQQLVKHEMFEALEQEELQTLVIPLAQIEWFEKGKELLISGELFDIKEYHVEGGNIVAKGLFDKKETALQASLEKSMKEDGNEAKTSKIIIKLISQTIFDDNGLVTTEKTSINIIKKKFPVHLYDLTNSDISFPYPPPKA